MIGKTIAHYRILEKLGEGGMGVVYKALDTKLERLVALKFLPPELTRDADARERFIREAQAASSLDHSNICTIHEIGEKDGEQIFISMACYEGETLKSRIKRSPLDIDEAIRIAVQVAEGLAKAHGRGIVHRDIKPGNVMVTDDGVAKIMDFGLAKLAGQPALTKTGSTLGTVAYMSPEQVQGDEADSRSDIWSLGVMLYEMLSAKLPFTGEHEAALLYSIVHEEALPLSSQRPGIPAPVSAVLAKALQKNPALRYQTARDLVSDLKKLSVSLTGMQPEEKSIVVLPFENLSPEHDQEYFSDGLTEEIISDLSNVHTLRVISRSSAMTFKGTKKKVPEIAREVGVQYVLEGSVRKAGNSLRITAQLIDATSDVHIWAEKFSGTMDDVFDVQEKVSRSIVDALKLKLTEEENQRVGRRPIDNVVAYECYLRANAAVWELTKSSMDRAKGYLEEGIAIVGGNPLLYSTLALVFSQYVNIGAAQEDYIARAQEYAQKALALDPDFPLAHEVLAIICRDFLGNTSEAIRHCRMALATDPNELNALHTLAYTYIVHIGRPSEAVPLMASAKRVDPLDSFKYFIEGVLSLYGGDYGQAFELHKRFYEADPQSPMAQFNYACSLVRNKRRDEAFLVVDESAKKTPDNVFTKFGMLLKYALLGHGDRAFREMTAEFQATCKRDAEWSFQVALMLSLLNSKADALDWLENAVGRGFINYPMLEREPFLSNIRCEDRFVSLLDRVRHEWEHFEVPE